MALPASCWLCSHNVSRGAGLQIQYSSLPNYEEREEDFNAEAVLLRRRFTEEGEITLISLITWQPGCRFH